MSNINNFYKDILTRFYKKKVKQILNNMKKDENYLNINEKKLIKIKITRKKIFCKLKILK